MACVVVDVPPLSPQWDDTQGTGVAKQRYNSLSLCNNLLCVSTRTAEYEIERVENITL